MANFNYLDFYRLPNSDDKKLFIKNNNNVVVWSISVFDIKSTILQNNNIRINLEDNDFVLIDFNNLYESKQALTNLQGTINTLKSRVPFKIDKETELYIANQISGSNSSRFTTGTAGYIAFYQTSVTVSSSNLYWDNTNGRLGIGTAMPAYNLSVLGNVSFISLGYSESNATYSLVINPSNGQLSYTASKEKEFLSADIQNSSTSSISFQKFVTKGSGYNRGISLTYSYITLNTNNSPIKTYKITTNFYIYNAATESYIYRAYLNGTYSGLGVYLGQNSILDFNYRMNNTTNIIVLTASATYSFWKFSSNTVNPTLVGNINITEL